MTTKLNTQCPNCQRWFTTQKSFKHHIRACRRAINGDTTSVIGNILPNPLLSASNSSISRQLSNHALDVNIHKSIEEVEDNYFDVVHTDSECQHDVETAQLDEQLASMPSIKKMFHPTITALTLCYTIFFKNIRPACSFMTRYQTCSTTTYLLQHLIVLPNWKQERHSYCLCRNPWIQNL